MDSFRLTIKTPEELVYEGKPQSVKILTEDGTIHIGPMHADLASTILETEISVEFPEETKRFAGRDGFVFFDNSKNEATILLFWCKKIEDIEEKTIDEYLDILKGQLESQDLSPNQVEYASRQQYASEKLIHIVKKAKNGS